VERGESASPWSADWKLKTGDGLHMRLTVLQAAGAGADPAPASVNITDGTAPAGGNPYEMKWIMLHNAGESPARTQVLSLMETYLGEPVIRDARPLALSGEDEAGFEAAACQVQLADRTDTIFASADPTVERSAEGGFRFAGRFGLYAERDGEPVAMSLVGGTVLRKGDFGIVADAAEYRGKITGVDREAPSITVSPAPPNVGAMVGAHIFITNSVRRVGCKVVDATQRGDAVEIRLDMDPCIGVGKVTGAEDFRVLTDTPFRLQGYEYYEGARLTNADGTAEYRINEVRSGVAAMIDAALHPEATPDRLATEFAEGTWFNVYDCGIGDEVVWPYAISVERTGEGAYRVTAPVEVRVSLPEGATTGGRRRQGQRRTATAG